MHRDQKQVHNILVPLLTGRCLEETPVAERDATMLNRAFLQGPDPLFLMEACPGPFAALCFRLDLDLAAGREAIERAHWQGPRAGCEYPECVCPFVHPHDSCPGGCVGPCSFAQEPRS